ncbi:MAG: peptide chain release factor N(5)-glutamine methyltransferase [Lachnospiraceae bacterium]|nr:peptide chain release factor N(5)-glutamine methyltransferase [Lachnospiraceae bacterium]
MNYRDMLKRGEIQLQESKIVDSKIDAWYLFEYVTGFDRQKYFMEMNEEVPENIFKRYKKGITRRSNHEPLQYIIGSQEFMGLDFEVNDNVLIPRQDTENLVEEVNKIIEKIRGERNDGRDLKHSARDKNDKGNEIDVLDMCTGSGCIIISLASMNEDVYGTAVDLSKEALSVARKNAVNNSVIDRVEFYDGDLFDAITDNKECKIVRVGLACAKTGPARQKFDIIVSNPPYIKTAEIAKLMPEVGEFEPMMALDGTEDGLHFYREIASEAPTFLKENGYLAVEIGFDQGEDVRKIFENNNFCDVKVIKDYQDNDRIVVGYIGG